MTKKEALEKLANNEQIKKFQSLLTDSYGNFVLVGGAVVDILEGREPKDYDFISTQSMDCLTEAGWKFLHSSSTADTFNFNGVICQVLKKPIEDFEFTISQSRICIKKSEVYDLGLDITSFNNKILIPVGWERKHVKDCLLRIPHYKKKGYLIPDETYLSLVRTALKSNKGLNS